MRQPPSILFVCLGNICRSPLAEGAFRAESAALGLDLVIDSAGTGDWHAGEPPDPRAIAAARRAGIDISGQRARQVAAQDFRRFSHILAMDGDNLAGLKRIAPADGRASLSRLLEHTAAGTFNVPDPYYSNDRAFDETVALVRQGVLGLLAHLRQSGWISG